MWAWFTCLTVELCSAASQLEKSIVTRRTFATELPNAGVSVYSLMKLLGHESIVTSQRYVTAAGTETHTAAA